MSEDFPLVGYNLRFELPGHPEFTEAVAGVEINYAKHEINMSITEDRGGKMLRLLLDLRENYYKRLRDEPHEPFYLDAKVVEDDVVHRTMRFTFVGVEKLKGSYSKPADLSKFGFFLDTDPVRLSVTFTYDKLQFLK